jgi:hypothetical protein
MWSADFLGYDYIRMLSRLRGRWYNFAKGPLRACMSQRYSACAREMKGITKMERDTIDDKSTDEETIA